MPRYPSTWLAWAVAATLGMVGSSSTATAATPLTSCATLDALGGSYVLGADLSSCGPCFVIANDRITLDLGPHTITGECPLFGDGITDDGEPRQTTSIKNGTVTGFVTGINLGSSSRSQIRNVTSSANTQHGMRLGSRSLVIGCTAADNGSTGIMIAEGGQVQGCVITGNAGIGIFGATQMLITRNTVTDNLTGIVVGQIALPDDGAADFPSTVSFNTASENQLFGILAGGRVLVTGNFTDANGADGITFGALSSVTFNVSRGNGLNGIDAGLVDLFDATRSLVTGNVTTDNGLAGIVAQCPSDVTNNTSSGNQVADYDPPGLPGCRAVNNH